MTRPPTIVDTNVNPSSSPIQAQHEPGQSENSTPQGVAGWLGLLVAGVLVVMPIGFAVEVSNLAETEDLFEYWGGAILLAALAAYSIYTGVALLRRWPDAPRSALRFIAVIAVVTVIGFVMIANERVGGNTSPVYRAGQTAGALLWPVIWGLYLAKSKRVRNTYATPTTTTPARNRVRFMAMSFGILILWLGGAQRSGAMNRLEARFHALNPYQLVIGARASEFGFDQGFANGALNQLRETAPDGTLKQDGAVDFLDGGSWIRGRIRFIGEIGDGSGKQTVSVRGEIRTFYHVAGAAVLESYCFPEVVDCDLLEKLLARAEVNLTPRIVGSQLSGVLPDGDCEVSEVPFARRKTPTDILTCSYASDGVAISLSRSSLNEARDSFVASITDPKVRRLIVRKVFEHRAPE